MNQSLLVISYLGVTSDNKYSVISMGYCVSRISQYYARGIIEQQKSNASISMGLPV